MGDADAASHRVGLVTDNDQVDVVRHETVRPDAKAGAARVGAEESQVAAPVAIVEEHRLAAVSTVRDVMRAARVSDPSDARHIPALERPGRPGRVYLAGEGPNGGDKAARVAYRQR